MAHVHDEGEEQHMIFARRNSDDVLADLAESEALDTPRRESEKSKRIKKIIPYGLILLGSLVISNALGKPDKFFVISIVCCAGFYLLSNSRKKAADRAQLKRMDFYLPIVMERILMGVQASLDILPALYSATEIEKTERQAISRRESVIGFTHSNRKSDPVTSLLRDVCRLTENGGTLEESLRLVAGESRSACLRHAFIHLALAYKEGGEVITSLTELSDATQLHFQESTEEDIAKMPAQTLLPLLFTFTGLILVFVTSPIIQVLTLTSTSIPK